jgi:hypothetical protein
VDGRAVRPTHSLIDEGFDVEAIAFIERQRNETYIDSSSSQPAEQQRNVRHIQLWSNRQIGISGLNFVSLCDA